MFPKIKPHRANYKKKLIIFPAFNIRYYIFLKGYHCPHLSQAKSPSMRSPTSRFLPSPFFRDTDGLCPSQSLSAIVVIIIFMKALALLLEEEKNTLSSTTDMADSAVFWKINTDTAAIMLRDKLIVEVQQATLIYQF